MRVDIQSTSSRPRRAGNALHLQNMEKQVKVKITRDQESVIVSNNFGKKWTFPIEQPQGLDYSNTACIAQIASAMLTGTIASHLQNVSSPKLEYTLTIKT